jgi:hypothetical protein
LDGASAAFRSPDELKTWLGEGLTAEEKSAVAFFAAWRYPRYGVEKAQRASPH